MRIRLGVNIDHVATLRQLRGTPYPNLLEAAQICESAGADQITVHLREDRRHIQDSDVKLLRQHVRVPLNLECSLSPEMLKHALKVVPDWACIVPEKRQELTTEGGLDLKKYEKKTATAIQAFHKKGIRVSLFIEPSLGMVRLSKKMNADAVEFHTGRFCHATQALRPNEATQKKAKHELQRLIDASNLCHELGIRPHAGHGIDYENVRTLVRLRTADGLPLIEELNIGHSIVCRASLVGMQQAVREMIGAIQSP